MSRNKENAVYDGLLPLLDAAGGGHTALEDSAGCEDRHNFPAATEGTTFLLSDQCVGSATTTSSMRIAPSPRKCSRALLSTLSHSLLLLLQLLMMAVAAVVVVAGGNVVSRHHRRPFSFLFIAAAALLHIRARRSDSEMKKAGCSPFGCPLSLSFSLSLASSLLAAALRSGVVVLSRWPRTPVMA